MARRNVSKQSIGFEISKPTVSRNIQTQTSFHSSLCQANQRGEVDFIFVKEFDDGLKWAVASAEHESPAGTFLLFLMRRGDKIQNTGVACKIEMHDGHDVLRVHGRSSDPEWAGETTVALDGDNRCASDNGEYVLEADVSRWTQLTCRRGRPSSASECAQRQPRHRACSGQPRYARRDDELWKQENKLKSNMKGWNVFINATRAQDCSNPQARRINCAVHQLCTGRKKWPE